MSLAKCKAAQRNLLLAFNLRDGGLDEDRKNHSAHRPRRPRQNRPASTSPARWSLFLTSDVIWSQRIAPLIQQTLADGGVRGQSTSGTQFLPNLGWLEPATVLARLTGQTSGLLPRAGQANAGNTRFLAPRRGERRLRPRLNPRPTLNHIGGGANPTFTVKVEDWGSNTPRPASRSKVSVARGRQGIQGLPRNRQDRTGRDGQRRHPGRRGPAGSRSSHFTVYVQPVPGRDEHRKQQGHIPRRLWEVEAARRRRGRTQSVFMSEPWGPVHARLAFPFSCPPHP